MKAGHLIFFPLLSTTGAELRSCVGAASGAMPGKTAESGLARGWGPVRLALSLVLGWLGAWSLPLWAIEAPVAPVAPVVKDPAQSTPVERLTDVELTDLAADWGDLDDARRTELVNETLERMYPVSARGSAQSVRAQSRGSQGPVDSPLASSQVPGAESSDLVSLNGSGLTSETAADSVASETSPAAAPTPERRLTQRTVERRRYGRMVRQADGSVVRIETQVVRIQSGDPRRAYGVGFEQRHDQQQASSPDAHLRDSPMKAAAELDVRQNVLSVQDSVAH